jgi:hypothetical protein
VFVEIFTGRSSTGLETQAEQTHFSGRFFEDLVIESRPRTVLIDTCRFSSLERLFVLSSLCGTFLLRIRQTCYKLLRSFWLIGRISPRNGLQRNWPACFTSSRTSSISRLGLIGRIPQPFRFVPFHPEFCSAAFATQESITSLPKSAVDTLINPVRPTCSSTRDLLALDFQRSPYMTFFSRVCLAVVLVCLPVSCEAPNRRKWSK